jgi:glycosyltransferase involved in cell wall biosynthesis
MIEWGYPKEKMRLVRNPFQVDVPELPLGNKIIYLGRVHAEKGIKLLLEAAKELPEYEFVIAGTGPADNWVDAFIKQYNLTNITRWGWVSKNELPKLMTEAKIIVVPSIFYENCPVTILEALSFKRVVVASDRGGTRELVIEGKTGFLCKPEDSTNLKEVLQKVMTAEEDGLTNITRQGKELVEKNHTLQNYLLQLEKLYKKVVVRD